jgi:hypothetical protein
VLGGPIELARVLEADVCVVLAVPMHQVCVSMSWQVLAGEKTVIRGPKTSPGCAIVQMKADDSEQRASKLMRSKN